MEYIECITKRIIKNLSNYIVFKDKSIIFDII